MKRVTLFSALTGLNQKKILEQILPVEITHKTIAYMPSGGPMGAKEYIREWEAIAQQYGTVFNVINNQVRSADEQSKLHASNILVISGGNTFNLLHSLRESGLDNAIKQFLNKPEFVLAGFSAGALVLTPNIKVCSLPGFDENLIGLKDLDALSIVDFEVFPHYNKDSHEETLVDYRKTTNNPVREITDEDYISIGL